MREAADNPIANKLDSGVSETALAKAISTSGHPLQAAVIDCISNKLRGYGRLSAQEEWSYVDSDSSQVRALDALVELSMWENDERGMNPRIRPTLNILVECKQSQLPYIFFFRESGFLPSYPVVAGLPNDIITVTTTTTILPTGDTIPSAPWGCGFTPSPNHRARRPYHSARLFGEEAISG